MAIASVSSYVWNERRGMYKSHDLPGGEAVTCERRVTTNNLTWVGDWSPVPKVANILPDREIFVNSTIVLRVMSIRVISCLTFGPDMAIINTRGSSWR